MFGFLRDLAFAIRSKGFGVLKDAIPFATPLVEIVADALARRKARHEQAALKDDIAVIARIESRDEAKRVAAEIAREVVDRGPLEIQLQLENYLAQVPQALRQSLRRPEDPSGKTVGARFDESPEHIAQMLPQRLPRFQAGDKPDCLRGEWVLEELLGTGGFGEVWKARHADFDGTVAAIKFCLDPAAQDRLLKHEGQLINQVMKHGSHPGIVPLLDASLRTNPPWLRYEYIAGGDLLLLFNKLKPLSIADRLKTALPFFEKLCEAVGHFHRLNPPVVHRDLKPSNILMMKTAAGGYRVRISDFGISQLSARHTLEQADASAPNLSMAGTLRGAHSLIYSSPQQRKGEPADVRDDVYSLGIILYQLLKADPNAERPGGLDWADELREGGVAEEVVKLIGSCIADRIDRRPKDGSKIAEALKALQAPPPIDTSRKEKTDDEKKVVADLGDRSLFPNLSHSRSIGSLKTGDIRLGIGDIIEIFGEGKDRQVTDVMGSEGNYQATFKGQGPLPTGDVAWRIVSRIIAQSSVPDGGDVIARAADQAAKPSKAKFGPLKLGSRFTNDIGMEFTWIPPGQFLMGSPNGVGSDLERPQHQVTISRGFFMGVHPVTQQHWKCAMTNNRSTFKNPHSPVEEVCWNDCQNFVEKLRELDGWNYRLPTEAEWEYACRAGTTTQFFFGDSESRLGEFAWFDGNSGWTTHPVGQKKPNPWGLHDIAGNVWEWCADRYGPYSGEKQTDPAGASSGDARVLRGGPWGYGPWDCRSATRFPYAPGERRLDFGVRVVFCLD